MSQPEITEALQRELGRLFLQSLKLSSPLYQLELIREKLSERGYQSFDKGDILDEIAQVQHLMGQMAQQMLKIYDTLKQHQE